MNMRHFLALVLIAVTGAAQAATDADVERSFNPYKDGFPTFSGLLAGMTINKSNVEQFKDVMDAGLYLTVKNGWDEWRVGQTTEFEMNKHYVEATRKNV